MKKSFIASKDIRLDKFLSQQLQQSRNQIEQLIKKGFVCIDEKLVKKTSTKLQLDQVITVTIPEIKSTENIIQYCKWYDDIKIIYEDKYILVLNKPSGVIVHNAPSVKEPTLVDWLKKHNITLSTISGEERHGIVHRLDKGTSGLMVIAKTNEAHINLSKQLENKSMGRYYIAVIDIPLKKDIIVEAPIYRNRKNRLKMGIVENGKYAKSAFKKLIISDTKNRYEIISAKLFTGRTHQIRVHLESLNRHIIGDTLYGFKGKDDNIQRVYLHAYCLYLTHPVENNYMQFVASLPQDMCGLIEKNFKKEEIDEKINQHYIIECFNDIDKWM